MYNFFISGSCERCVFHREGRSTCHEVFFREYLPLALKVNKEWYIDCSGVMAANKSEKHLFEVTR